MRTYFVVASAMLAGFGGCEGIERTLETLALLGGKAVAYAARIDMKRLTALVMGILWAGAALAQQDQSTVANRRGDDFTLRNFHFQSGEILPELRIHYVTLGTPRRVTSGRITNAVLLLHGTGQSGQLFLSQTAFGTNLATALFSAGQPLDSERYYVIIPDAIGHGRSSKPSDGLRAKFPH